MSIRPHKHPVPVKRTEERHMFTLNGLVEIARRYRVRRERRQLARVISGLSEDIQKDIGWRATDLPARHARRVERTVRSIQ